MNKFHWSLVVLILLVSLGLSLTSVVSVNAQGGSTTLRIHYHRPDGEYEPWNLWIWPDGSEGQVYQFDDDTVFGKVATVGLDGTHERVGFIVRTDSWAKDVQADRFVEDFTDGVAEIWLLSGDPTIYTAPPDGHQVETPQFDEIDLTVHYLRYDKEYEGWNLWIWPDQKEGGGYTFTESDDYGLVANVKLSDMSDVDRIGIIVRHSTPTNEWNSKDINEDRFIPIFRADDSGKIEVWLMQNDERIYYKETDVDSAPSIISAVIDSPRVINTELNLPIQFDKAGDNGFKLTANGQQVEIEKVLPVGFIRNGQIRQVRIFTTTDLDLNTTYRLERDNFEPAVVGFGDIFSSFEFAEKFHYDGDDLGAKWSQNSTTFRVWAPTASELTLLIYPDGNDSEGARHPMQRDVQGTWVTTLTGDLHGKYYNYQVTVGETTNIVMDPYAKAAGVNGFRGMIVDLKRTNPTGWDKLAKPSYLNYVDAVIYELHVRDLSSHPNSGITNAGKFVGIIEEGTTGPNGVKTGLDHLKELGITHLHLLPSFDYHTIDETRLDQPQFNWGYDPQNYNIPEGSYSTDPYNGEVRIKEFKQMVQGLNENGIRVVMDVVYNHTSRAADSHLNQLVPGYYYRMNSDGTFSNGSGCGNELADERSMVRKMIVDSVVYWATEYKVDGFRFDLMGLHHVDTMNAVRAALNEVDPRILVYGEGWQGASSPLPDSEATLKASTRKVPGIAAFSDDVRDGIKGHVFNDSEPAFIQGAPGFEESVKFGVVASTDHRQISYRDVNYSDAPWAGNPGQTITYAEAHDNLTLWDKLAATSSDESEEERLKMHRMASAIVLTSQGIPFIHAGQDFVRTKFGDENSYKSPDEINQLDWERKTTYLREFEYNRGLIGLRKDHPAFRMTSTMDIQKHLRFMDMPTSNMVGYTIKGHANNDPWETIVVLFNANTSEQTVQLPGSNWVVVVDGERAGTSKLAVIEGDSVVIPPRSSLVLVDEKSFN